MRRIWLLMIAFLLLPCAASAQNSSYGQIPGTTVYGPPQAVNQVLTSTAAGGGGGIGQATAAFVDTCHLITSLQCPGFAGSAVPYPLSFFFAGPLPLSGSEADCAFVPNAATIPVNLARSGCSATAATATSTTALSVIDIPYGGTPSTIATLTFAGGAKDCTLSTQAAIPIAAKDTVCVVGPASSDATLAGVAATIYATTTDYP
jgi:hypothetical protein